MTRAMAAAAVRAVLEGASAVRVLRVGPAAPRPRAGPSDLRVDITVGGRRQRLLVIVLTRGEPSHIERVAGALQAAGTARGGRSVVVAPYVSERGRSLCRDLGLGFVDLAGNASIELPGLSLERWGKDNPRRERRLLRSVFSRKATRVLRKMLVQPGRRWTVQSLGLEARVSPSHAHKVVTRLEEEGFVEREWGGIRLGDPGGLLDAWRQRYDVRDQAMVGYYGRRVGEEGVEGAVADLDKGSYALTLGAAASLVAPFVRTTDVHLYVVDDPEQAARRLDLEPVEFGGNVHLITPYDEGVLYDARAVGGLAVVSDVQLYLDLYNWPARGREQAEHLRERAMGV